MFDDVYDVLVLIGLGTAGYVLLIVLLRCSGKRTLSKWNAFDFVVTIAFGSVLASMIVSPDRSFARGALALGLLIGLQFIVSWVSVRVPAFQRIVKSRPRLLVYQGRLIDEAIRRERITVDEVRAAARENGMASIGQAFAIVIETDGTLSVIRDSDTPESDALFGVVGFPESDNKQS